MGSRRGTCWCSSPARTPRPSFRRWSATGATVFFGVPTLFEYLKEHKDTGKVNWRRLKLVLSGADTLHESTVAGWARRTGSSITEGYGMSETCAISHVNPVQKPKPGSFGCPVPGVLAAVVDAETRAFVPPDQIGELVLSGPNVMSGYWNRPEETARAFLEARRAPLAPHRRHRAHGRGGVFPFL